MNELLKYHRAARLQYAQEDFAAFFELGSVEAPAQRLIFKDILVAAGAMYRYDSDLRAQHLPKNKVLRELQKLQKASGDLSRVLEQIGDRSTLAEELSRTVMARRDALRQTYGEESGTYNILGSIFPFDPNGNGFRKTGLQNSLKVLSEALASIEDDQVPKIQKGRISVLENWLSTLSVVWLFTKGKLPTSGHYDQGIGDYDSADVAALTRAIEPIDPDVSSRLIAEAMKRTGKQFQHGPMQAMIHFSATMAVMLGSAETYTHKENLRMFCRMASGGQGFSDEGFDSQWGALLREDQPSAEQEIVSEQQFHETLKVQDSEGMLLRAFVEVMPK